MPGVSPAAISRAGADRIPSAQVSRQRRHDPTLFQPGGCAACGGTGYRGRTAIAELLVFDEKLSRCVVSRADASTLIAEARAGGMVDLHSDGLAKAAAGITSLDEVMRVTGTA
jgi:general secretion pathway protein E